MTMQNKRSLKWRMKLDIKGVEIFSTGEWNGRKYTREDLEAMVTAYKENEVGFRPFLKLGHDKDQKVAKELMESDGYPALGWVSNMYVLGEKLLADFSDIPAKLYNLIQSKAYRKVSIELFMNAKVGEKVYSKLIGAVALLGASNPGVMDLADILSTYTKFKSDEMQIFDNGVEITKELQAPERDKNMSKTEREIELEAELKKQKEEFTSQAQKVADMEKSKSDTDKELETLRREKAEAFAKAEEARVETFCTELVSDKLATPAMKPLIKDLLNTEKKEFSIKVKDKDEKLTREGVLKEILKLQKAAAEVNFEQETDKGKGDGPDNHADIHKKALEYSKAHNVSYGQATKIILEQNKEIKV